MLDIYHVHTNSTVLGDSHEHFETGQFKCSAKMHVWLFSF